VRPFLINNYNIKQDPVQTLQMLKKLKVNPLSVAPLDSDLEQIHQQNANLDDLKLNRTS